MRSNKTIMRFAVYSLWLLFIIIGLEALVFLFNYVKPFLIDNLTHNLLGALGLFCFIPTAVIYLIWYQRLHNNYWAYMNLRKDNWYFMMWMLPIAHVIQPSARFRLIASKYIESTEKDQEYNVVFLSRIWSILFGCWYITTAVWFVATPLFPDDLAYYNAVNLVKGFVYELLPRLLCLMGLFVMIKIVQGIWVLEAKVIDKWNARMATRDS